MILDTQKCLRNMERMVRKAQEKQLELRPHCKTHQSAEIASWFREFGVYKITVSSFSMALKGQISAHTLHPEQISSFILLFPVSASW